MRSRTGRLARLARGRRLDRNPLRRGSDRAQTIMSCTLLAGFLAAAPFAAHAAGSWAYVTSAREAQTQQATIRQVPATVTQTPSATAAVPGAEAVSFSVAARWRAPDGQERTGELVVPSGAKAGSAVPVWVDKAGQLADPPLSRVQLAARAELAGELVVGALGIALAAASWLTRWILDRRRMAAWDADWLTTGPRWSRQR